MDITHHAHAKPTILILVNAMTKLIQQTKKAEGLEPDSKSFLKSKIGITNLPPRVENDPIKEQEDRFSNLLNLKEQIATLEATFKEEAELFKSDLLALEEEYEDTGVKPIIYSETTRAKVFLRRTLTYKHTPVVEKKAEKINNLKKDLKALKEKEVREDKAILKSQKTTVVLQT